MYGLIFDVDGIIADTEAVNVRASIAMFEELFGLKGVCRKDFEAGLGRGAAAYVCAAAEVHGLDLDDNQVQAAAERRQENFLRMLKESPLPAFPGVMELIREAMEAKDFTVAIATSSTREKSQAVLNSAQIPWRELTYITGSDVKNKKPDPELFVTAANKAGVDPKRSVVIEDAPNGVEAALAAGCKCIAVTNSVPAEQLKKADLVVSSLIEVSLTIIRQILS